MDKLVVVIILYVQFMYIVAPNLGTSYVIPNISHIYIFRIPRDQVVEYSARRDTTYRLQS